MHPPLTTIVQPAYEIGDEAIAALMRLIGKEELARRVTEFKPQLMVRESCKSP